MPTSEVSAGMDVTRAREWLERALPEIERIIGRLCRRHGLVGDEADSFGSYAHERLIEGDFRAIRAYSGRAQPVTYLTLVLTNVFRDFRIRRWGKWRPSAAARRMGRAAVLLDTYIHRDGHPREEAIRRVISRDDVDLTEGALREVARRLPPRISRTMHRLDDVPPPASDHRADGRLEMAERAARIDEAKSALERALSELPDQDQAILRLHYWEGLTVADVARTLGLEQRPLYRRIRANHRLLRTALVERGIDGQNVQDLMP